MEILIGLLLALAVPFILPIVSWISSRNTRARVESLEEKVARLQRTVDALADTLRQAPRQVPRETTAPVPVAPPPQPIVTVPPPPKRGQSPFPERGQSPFPERGQSPFPERGQSPFPERGQSPFAGDRRANGDSPHLPGDRRAPRWQLPTFDWESLVGVKLFSAIAGIALVIAAISFLRYSIEHGWLEPPVRVAIGILVSIALLVVCELKAARKYPATANAMDAAAIAILFSTFFAAHALWNLIGSAVTFALLAIVTATAVLLSIRRDSLIIAVLGLVGGFATPILLSTGENQPIPLFAYLLLLNIGLAWVAYGKGWTVLTILTLVLTTLYQWGWVIKFLTVSQLPLAVGIFLIFPIVAFAGRAFAARGAGGGKETFERAAVIAAALPLLFAIYLAVVPAYGAYAGLLFGFLFLLVAGLLAVSIAGGQELLHALSGFATLVVFAVHRLNHTEPITQILLFVTLFVLFFLLAPAVAARSGRPFSEWGENATLAAPLLLFVPASLAWTPAAASPGFVFGVMFALMLAIAGRAIAAAEGPLYFVGTFAAVAAQALWSAEHLTIERLGTAIAWYSAFGVLQLVVPVIARRRGAELEPESGTGVLLLASVGLLLFIATGETAPAALWGLALLLAVLNAAMFIESAAGRLPLVSIAGGIASWLVLGAWWYRAAASVGVLPSLLVMVALTLVMLAGHAWVRARVYEGPADVARSKTDARFDIGLYLGLIAHLFLCYVALNREWSLPPWPLFATLFVITLAVSTASLYTGTATLHLAGIVASGVVLALWTAVAPTVPWPTVALVAGAALSLFGLAWRAPLAALAALFASEAVAIIAGAHGAAAPSVIALGASHAATLAAVLAVTWRGGWHRVALGASVAAALALLVWRAAHPGSTWWNEFLGLATVLYVVLTAYPFLLGRRAAEAREPYLLAVISAGIFFFAARDAFVAGDLRTVVGIIPVVEGAVLALLLRQLLRIEPAGRRDLGRLALVAAAALAFATVAIPLQLKNQWITIGWAFEAAALAWLFRKIPHRGLLLATAGLIAAVFVRLALNPDIFYYEPRGAMRVLNWYLYTYALSAAAMLLASWWLWNTEDRLAGSGPRLAHVSAAAATILLFILLNIEIADFYATGPEITFRFGAAIAQDLTYTIGWLAFGVALLAAGIVLKSHTARVTAVALIAITTFKCFLYDLSSLAGLYRVTSFVGLAIALALVSLALQKYVLARPQEKTS